MVNINFEVRKAKPEEYNKIGQLMVDVYSRLEGFPKKNEQPAYYTMLENVGDFIRNPDTEILVAIVSLNKISGAVVYFGNMQYYGSEGIATKEKNAAGFRLLAVSADSRGLGIGKVLTEACIEKAKHQNREQLIIHSTKAMQIAWKMYEKIGFKRSEDLDFMQGDLQVYGFRLMLSHF